MIEPVLHLDDCRTAMAGMDPESIDAIVTDPPYGLSFMGKGWDHGVPGVEFWQAALRVLKPGGHLLAFGGTRMHHRLMVAIEDAGFEIRDCLMWLYGKGFPKSLDVSKAIDKAAGAEREVVGKKGGRYASGFSDAARDHFRGMGGTGMTGDPTKIGEITAPATPEAAAWQGWGTALKPAHEDVVVARKPFDHATELRYTLESLTVLEARLCLLLGDARLAAAGSTSSQSVQELLGSARWSAAESSATRADLCGATDTSRFESAVLTSLSIVSSWRRIWAEGCEVMSTFTTATTFATTTDWRTLRFCLSQITPATIIPAAIQAGGYGLLAAPAARFFNAVSASIDSILARFAPEIATGSPLESYQAADALSPSREPIILARKPLVGTVAANVLAHGTGALNIDGCRVPTAGEVTNHARSEEAARSKGRYGDSKAQDTHQTDGQKLGRWPANLVLDEEAAALLDEQTGDLGRSSGTEVAGEAHPHGIYGSRTKEGRGQIGYGDNGGASRFFYCSKASPKDRNYGLNNMEKVEVEVQWEGEVRKATLRVDTGQSPPKVIAAYGTLSNDALEWNTLLFGSGTTGPSLSAIKSITGTGTSSTIKSPTLNWLTRSPTSASTLDANSATGSGGSPAEVADARSPSRSFTNEKPAFATSASPVPPGALWRIRNGGSPADHPTVKPINLMRWLVRLVTPPGGTVLDPFMGSGSTGVAAVLEGFGFVGIEQEVASMDIALPRIEAAEREMQA